MIAIAIPINAKPPIIEIEFTPALNKILSPVPPNVKDTIIPIIDKADDFPSSFIIQ